jgi:hypothetical protein
MNYEIIDLDYADISIPIKDNIIYDIIEMNSTMIS